MIDKKAIYIRDCDGCRCLGDSLEPSLHTYKPLIQEEVKQVVKKEIKEKIKEAVKKVVKKKTTKKK